LIFFASFLHQGKKEEAKSLDRQGKNKRFMKRKACGSCKLLLLQKCFKMKKKQVYSLLHNHMNKKQ